MIDASGGTTEGDATQEKTLMLRVSQLKVFLENSQIRRRKKRRLDERLAEHVVLRAMELPMIWKFATLKIDGLGERTKKELLVMLTKDNFEKRRKRKKDVERRRELVELRARSVESAKNKRPGKLKSALKRKQQNDANDVV